MEYYFVLVFLQVFFVKVEFVVIEIAEESGCDKFIKFATLFLGWATCTACTVDKTADATHFQQFVLVGCGYILQYVGNQFGSYPVLYGLKYSEGIGDGWFSHLDDITFFHDARWLLLDSIYHYSSVFASISGNGACLEYA